MHVIPRRRQVAGPRHDASNSSAAIGHVHVVSGSTNTAGVAHLRGRAVFFLGPCLNECRLPSCSVGKSNIHGAVGEEEVYLCFDVCLDVLIGSSMMIQRSFQPSYTSRNWWRLCRRMSPQTQLSRSRTSPQTKLSLSRTSPQT